LSLPEDDAIMGRRKGKPMSDLSFRMMVVLFGIVDFFNPYVGKRARSFGIAEGMTVVDYGCGPGRYTVHFAQIAGRTGKVYAVDIQPLAVETVRRKAAGRSLSNVEPMLARGYDSGLPDRVADMVFAIDMFFSVPEPTQFLAELRRIIKDDGTLVIDDGHQPRRVTKEKIAASGLWRIHEETGDHMRCKPA
jgi:ubiquinone/menaquinone biosynthesis C-methylase UbiE